MSIKEKIIRDWHKDSAHPENTLQQFDTKHPFDMKSFWKRVNESHFQSKECFNPVEASHLITWFSQHDIKSDEIYTKTGFPKNFSTFANKTLDPSLKKNNPILLTKFFGLHIYADSSDCAIPNNNQDLIKEEINFLNKKIEDVEHVNINSMEKLNHIWLHEYKKEKKERFKEEFIDWDGEGIRQQRFDNWINQIYFLQIKQFAESVSGIKRDESKNEYYVSFDPSEKYETWILNKKQYEEFIIFRDPHNSICVYDLFLEKTHSYYNTIPSKSIKEKKMVEFQVAKKSKFNTIIATIANNGSRAKWWRNANHRFLEIKKNKSIIIRDYDGDTEEYLEATKKIEGNCHCKRFFCHFCLKGSYDIVVEDWKDKPDWWCPFCQGQCFCSRCIRFDKILKLIGLYISLGGNINMLYDNLVTRNYILDILNKDMLVSKIMIMMNDTTQTPGQWVKRVVTNNLSGKNNNENIKKLWKDCEKVKGVLENLKDYFNNMYRKQRIDKCWWYYDKKIERNTNKIMGESLLNRKKIRDEKDDLVELARKHFSKKIIEDDEGVINDLL